MIFSKKANQNAEKQKINFEKEVFDAGMVPNLLTGLITLLYMITTTHLPKESIVYMVLWAVGITLFLQFFLAPITNKLITGKVSDDLDWFYNYESTERERTSLMKRTMGIPEKIGVEVFCMFIAGIICWTFICSRIGAMSVETIIMSLCSGFFGAYAGLVFAIEQTQKICSRHSANIIEKGVSAAEVSQKHCFGTSSTKITVFHIFGPIILINVFYMILAWRAYVSYTSVQVAFIRIISISIMNILFCCFLSSMLFKRMIKSINFTRTILQNINRNNLHNVKHSPTDLSNEFMYNIYLINTISDILQKILKASTDISMQVVESSNELSVISKETAVTSLEQNSSIKELLSAMEESDNLARNISTKIGEVSLVARRTTEVINDGFDILKHNMQKLSEIQQASETTLEGIESLSEKISGISDIARIINSIADQTNIIAFNAELEASRAGESGQNFHLVASEIRRLTNNTIQSTNEIRNRIIEIQHSSEKLLASSQSGRKKITAGNEIVEELYNNFTNLKESAETADMSSEEIKKIIEQQTASFEQIVVTLRQLSAAAETFSVSTQNINNFAESLCEVSEKLKSLQPKEQNLGA